MGGGEQQHQGGFQQGGGNIMDAINRMFMGNGFQQVETSPRSFNPEPIGQIEFPAANMNDPFGGPEWAQGGYDPKQGPFVNNMFNNFGNQPGDPWSLTLNPNQKYDPLGYPYATPVIPQDPSGTPHIHLSSPTKTK